MNSLAFLKLSIFTILFSFFISCSDDKDTSSGTNPIANSREVKYEITGTYSGHLDVVYSDENGNNKSDVITSLPWTKTVIYPSSLAAVAIGASSVIAGSGVVGQTGSMKIYVGNVIKRTSDKTVGQNGLLLFDTQVFTF